MMKSPFRTSREASGEHKTLRQKLERLDGNLLAIPQALNECLEAFSSWCLSGLKLASLMESFFQETPVLLVALRFREVCQQLGDYAERSGLLLRQEMESAVKKVAGVFGDVRGHLDSHGRAAAKHESYLRQLESLKSSQSASRHKVEQVEAKFEASAEEFAREDSRLAEALNELHKMKVEVKGDG